MAEQFSLDLLTTGSKIVHTIVNNALNIVTIWTPFTIATVSYFAFKKL